MYFNSNPRVYPAYTQAIDFLAAQNPKEVGLHGDSSVYYYPVWVQLGDRLNTRPRVEYVGVLNSSGKLRGGNHAPPLIFSKGSLSTLEGKAYRVVLENPLVTVLEMEGGGVNEIPEKWSRLLAESEQLVVRPDIDLYFDRNGKRLVYVKKRCQPAAGLSAQSHPVPAEPHIFLHPIPADVDDLPDYRKQYGFDNLAVDFNDYRIDIQLGERCIAVRNLPAYDLIGFHTGQETDEGRLWKIYASFK